MERLLDAVAAVVALVSPEKVQAIASRVLGTDAESATGALAGVVRTPTAHGVLSQLIDAWRSTTVSAEAVAMMLLAASHAVTKTSGEQTAELVWTGPTTPSVSARRTEQALMEVIRHAKAELFVTSYVAYNVSSVVNALNEASARGVRISLLLESAQQDGGRIKADQVMRMRRLVPATALYEWRSRQEEFFGGCVHAKVAVADREKCLITSANLTDYAMQKNMEAGVIIMGGTIPAQLGEHLSCLVATKAVERVG